MVGESTSLERCFYVKQLKPAEFLMKENSSGGIVLLFSPSSEGFICM